MANTPIIKTVVRIITLIGPEEAINKLLKDESDVLNVGRFTLKGPDGEKVIMDVKESGSISHSPRLPPPNQE